MSMNSSASTIPTGWELCSIYVIWGGFIMFHSPPLQLTTGRCVFFLPVPTSVVTLVIIYIILIQVIDDS